MNWLGWAWLHYLYTFRHLGNWVCRQKPVLRGPQAPTFCGPGSLQPLSLVEGWSLVSEPRHQGKSDWNPDSNSHLACPYGPPASVMGSPQSRPEFCSVFAVGLGTVFNLSASQKLFFTHNSRFTSEKPSALARINWQFNVCSVLLDMGSVFVHLSASHSAKK